MLNKSLLFLFAVLLGASLVRAHFTTGSSYEKDEKDRFDKCKPLVSNDGSSSESESSESSESSEGDSGEVSGSGSGSGSGNSSLESSGSDESSGSGSDESSGSGSNEWEDGEYCYLLQILLSFNLTVDISVRQYYIEWIQTTQITIVQNSALTEYEILVQIWYSLKILFQTYPAIEEVIRFQYIGDWGYVCDLEGLALDIQSVTTTVTIQEVITISGGSCPLFDALNDCAQNGTAQQAAAIQSLILQLTVIIEGSYSFEEKLVLIWEKFEAFFAQYQSIDIATLIYSGQIEGFGILQSFIDITTVYWRIDYFSIAVSGSTSGCELLDSLNNAWQNSSYNLTTRQDIKQLYNKTATYFLTTTNIQLRVQYFVEQLYQLLILAEWDIKFIYTLEIEGYGSVYDLIYAYIYSLENGITPGDFTSEAESTTVPTTPTTTTPTTTTPTTTAVPTTLAPNCTNAWTVNVLTSNTTLLISSIQAAQVTWTASENNTFLGWKKKIYAISANTSTSYRDNQKFLDIKQILLNFAGPSTSVYIKVQAVYISTWGYVSSYCGCASSGSSTKNSG